MSTSINEKPSMQPPQAKEESQELSEEKNKGQSQEPEREQEENQNRGGKYLFGFLHQNNKFTTRSRYLVLNLVDGSLSCYRYFESYNFPKPSTTLISLSRSSREDDNTKESNLLLDIFESCEQIFNLVGGSWVFRDVVDSESSFVIETARKDEKEESEEVNDIAHTASRSIIPPPRPHGFRNRIKKKIATFSHKTVEGEQSDDDSNDTDEEISDDDHNALAEKIPEGAPGTNKSLSYSISSSHRETGKHKRFIFNCPGGGNESAIWRKAAEQLNYAKAGISKKMKVAPSNTNSSRYRQPGGVKSSQGISERILRRITSMEEGTVEEVTRTVPTKEKEYRVQPTYAYPNEWMTTDEMYKEMMRPSVHFTDFRNKDADGGNGRGNHIGSIHVEVLGCLGLPKLDRFSENDSVVYLVCGGNAFCTDEIPNSCAPRWLCKANRAAIFPLDHAFARLYVGIFDIDGGDAEPDDFAGRVAIDIAKLRPNTEYDISLPLRFSGTVYSRRARGLVRLRLRLTWEGERAAVLSYLKKPKTMSTTYPVTVKCGSITSFRNVALTIHGEHIPGKFSQELMRSNNREVNLYRIQFEALMKRMGREILTWDNKFVSGYVFGGWLYCVYANTVALVPSYFYGFMIVMLLKNYATFVLNQDANGGFAPLTISELLGSLVFGEGCMKPLSKTKVMEEDEDASPCYQDPYLTNTLRNLGLFSDISAATQSARTVDTSMNDSTVTSSCTHSERKPCSVNHSEFPFSERNKYPKMSMGDAVANLTVTEQSSILPSSTVLFEENKTDLSRDRKRLERKICGPLSRTNIFESSTLAFEEDDDPQKPGSYISTDSINERDQPLPASPPSIPVKPEQDTDVRGRKLNPADELRIAKEKVHKFTFRVFDDQVFVVPKPTPADMKLTPDAYDDNSLDYDVLEKAATAAHKNAEQILGIRPKGSLSIAALQATYISPITLIVRVVLCFCRAGFNLFVWKDPFLTFWFLLFCVGNMVVLALFPWRLFMGVVGSVGALFHPLQLMYVVQYYKQITKAKKDKKKEERNKDDGFDVQDQQEPIFMGPSTHHNSIRVIASPSSKEKHIQYREVVVPYSRLRHERFYDWPPETSLSKATAVVENWPGDSTNNTTKQHQD